MLRPFYRRQFSPTDPLPYIISHDDAPIELRSLDVRVVITGLFAETTQILRLYNPGTRDLEGELCFPLPDDAAVCGYGIDVDGQLVDGTIVAKHEARRILEAEIRKGIDPGLVEQVQGNVYRTRIYPLPAGRDRTIKLVYVSRLSVAGNEAAFHLPLGHAAGVDAVSLRVEVSQTPSQPILTGGLGSSSFGPRPAQSPMEQRWVAEATLGPQVASEDLLVRLPNLPDHLTAVEQFEDQTYFCVSSHVPAHASGARAWMPQRVAVAWDASGSRSGADVERELALLEALAATWGRVGVDVCVLRNVLEPEVRAFEIESGNCRALIEYLRGLAYDGGTSLAALDLGALPNLDDEAWLLFGDGLCTIGAGLPKLGSKRVFVITSQARSDLGLLRHIAEQSGGACFNLLATRPDIAANMIATWADALRLEGTAGCEDVHVWVDAGRLTIVGRLTQDIGSVRLTGPGAPRDHLSVARGSATSGRNVARAWAGRQAQLERIRSAPEQTIVELGRRFGLVTPGTSLLVLETLEQHLEYDVEPAASRVAMREAFLAHRRKAKQDETKREAEQLGRVLSLWQARVQWWETVFEAKPPSDGKGGATRGGGGDGAEGSGQIRTRRMAAPARAAPPPMAVADFDDDECFADMEEAPMASGAMEEVSRDLVEREEPSPEPAGRGGSANASASIQIQAWAPDTPYLTRMRAVAPEQAYASYLSSRDAYARSPAFYLDCADFLLGQDPDEVPRALGLRVLSNLLELALDDPPLLRGYAWRMQQAGEIDAAIEVFERVLRQRDDEPQSHRDLALALEQRWQRDGNPDDAVRAMELLWAVIIRQWERFPEIELIALMELNRLIHLSSAAGITTPAKIDRRLIRVLDLDVRISMSWDADLTDVDLHVFEPTGEHAYYGHNQTSMGGLVSRDFREGYGPEEYVLRRATPGEYTIKAHYYGSHQQTIAGACTVIVTVFTNYARANEAKQLLTLRLERASDQALVGKITIAERSG